MYIISIFLFLLFAIGISLFSAEPKIFIDLPSLLIIIGLTLPLIVASGLFNDFVRGFVIMTQQANKFTPIELKRSLEAVKLAIIGILLSGILGTLVGFVAICHNAINQDSLLTSLGIASLSSLYSLVLVMMLLPMLSRIKSLIYTLEQ